jgi:ubiquinone/menaquinone biosynthesis C-methylase UbiE
MPAEPFKYDGTLNDSKKKQILRFCRKSVLDVGCNTGEIVGFLNSIGIYSEGIDINQNFILTAKSKFPKNIFHLGDNLSIFKDNQFETVLAWDVLEHIPDDAHALKEFVRVAHSNVVLSVPKEDEISLPYSRVTYRPYVDPTHLHYYTRDILAKMVSQLGDYTLSVEEAYRVRPLMAYEKIGISLRICSFLDRLFWRFGKNKELFYANLVAEITGK